LWRNKNGTVVEWQMKNGAASGALDLGNPGSAWSIQKAMSSIAQS